MNVLVKGTDGYIGSVMGPYLMNNGISVTCLDTGFYRAGWLFNNGEKEFPGCKPHLKTATGITGATGYYLI